MSAFDAALNSRRNAVDLEAEALFASDLAVSRAENRRRLRRLALLRSALIGISLAPAAAVAAFLLALAASLGATASQSILSSAPQEARYPFSCVTTPAGLDNRWVAEGSAGSIRRAGGAA